MSNYTQPVHVSKRVRFYDGQFLQDQDFIDEQNYHLDRQARLGRSLQVAGIVEGLEVTATGDALSVFITAGTAVDLQGHTLVLTDSRTQFDKDNEVVIRPATEPFTIPPVPGQSEQYLYVAYCQVPVDLQQGEQGLQGETRWQEAPFLFLASGLLGSDDNYDRPPWDEYVATRPTPVLLTRLQISLDGQVTVTGPRVYSGLRLAGPGEGASWAMDENGRVQLRNGQDVPPLSIVGDNLGIGTVDPGAYRLNVSGGDTLLGGNLTVKGSIQLDGPQKLLFTDADIGNNLKVQLYSGYGLGIDGETLFYAANGRHSWRDNNGANERMALTTGADGGLTVSGTGNSSIAGRLGIGTADPGAYRLNVSAGNTLLGGSLTVNGASTLNGAIHLNGPVRGSQENGQLIIQTEFGSLTLGSGYKDWTHFYTDNSVFYFNKEIRVNSGYIGSYDENLTLRTQGIDRLTINKDSGKVTILGQLWVMEGGVEKLLVSKINTLEALLYPSDERLKHDIQKLRSPLEKVCQLRGVSFKWNEVGLNYFTQNIETHLSVGPDASDEENKVLWQKEKEKAQKKHSEVQIGLIAQNVKEIVPEIVKNDDKGFLKIDYQQLTALLVAAINEQNDQFSKLASRLEALENV